MGRRTFLHSLSLMTLAAFAGAALPRDAAAESVDFSGKTIRMLLGQAPGGGADASARLVARFLGEYLPGKPTIVVQHMPGANGIVSANYLVQQVTPDGLTFISGSSSQITAAVDRHPSVQYDPAKFEFIGSFQDPGTMLLAQTKAKARLADPKADPVIMAQVGVARPGALFTIWGSEYLGWNVKSITGYRSSQEVILAVQRGEAEMLGTGNGSILQPMIASGDFAGVAQVGIFSNGKFTRRDDFKDVPLISELVGDKLTGTARGAFQAWLSAALIGKYFALPPKTPPEVIAAYREAFTRMGNNPEFQELAKAQIDPDSVVMSGEDTTKLIARLVNAPVEDLVFLNQLRAKYGLQSGEVAAASR